MRAKKIIWMLSVFLVFIIACSAEETPELDLPTSPPFSGTIFIDPDIITSSDPGTFVSIESAGKGIRTMYDRRVNDWIEVEAFLFNASFSDKALIEVQVNPEFETTEAAHEQALKYAVEIGRLPAVLKKDVETVWIHKGKKPFGGGNNNLLIHTEQALDYIKDGILEETLVHEAAHTSLDKDHAQAADWIKAQNSDPTYISSYAKENSTREDIAESFLPYLAVQYRSDRISAELEKTIRVTIPNRLKYFENQDFNVLPLE